MIEGIEVLRQTDILVSQTREGWWIPILISLVIAIIFAVIAIKMSKKANNEHTNPQDKDKLAILSIMLLSLAVGAMFFSLSHATKIKEEVPSGKYEYEVVIDESVGFREIHDAYEVIDSNGDVYTLRDKMPKNTCSFCDSKVDALDKYCSNCGHGQ